MTENNKPPMYKGVNLDDMVLLPMFNFSSREEEIEFKRNLVDSDEKREMEWRNAELKQKRKRKDN